MGPELADVGLAVGFYFLSGFGITAGFHRYFTHRAFKANRGLRDRAGDRREPRPPGRRHHLGRRSPPSPRLHRQGGRPALALAVRHHPGRGGARDSGTPTWDGPSTETGPTSPASPPTCSPIRDISRIARQFPLWTVVSLLSPALLGGLDHHDPGGARSPRSSGPASSASRCCTTSPGRSTRSATSSATGPYPPRPLHQRLAAGHRLDGRVLAQPAPRRPHLRPPRRAPRSDRHDRPADLDRSRSSAGPTTSAGPPRDDSPDSSSDGRTSPQTRRDTSLRRSGRPCGPSPTRIDR